VPGGEGELFVETVMSHPSKVQLLEEARAAGFKVAVYFVATQSVDLNVRRVQQRVALGGHNVPNDKIRERYPRTLALLPAAIALADEVVLFDNSFGKPAVIRPFFRRSGARVTLQPPVPNWARPAIKAWLPT
jgi:predicted ABC-type ATPase